jgi:hypothetical protein
VGGAAICGQKEQYSDRYGNPTILMMGKGGKIIDFVLKR